MIYMNYCNINNVIYHITYSNIVNRDKRHIVLIIITAKICIMTVPMKHP